MNELCILYIALYCVLLYSQSSLQSSVCSHHTPATGGEYIRIYATGDVQLLQKH